MLMPQNQFGHLDIKASKLSGSNILIQMTKPYLELLLIIACIGLAFWYYRNDLLKPESLAFIGVFLAFEIYYIFNYIRRIHTTRLELNEGRIKLTHQSLIATQESIIDLSKSVLAIEDSYDQTLLVLNKICDENKLVRTVLLGRSNLRLSKKHSQADFHDAVQSLVHGISNCGSSSNESVALFLDRPDRIKSMRELMKQTEVMRKGMA